MIENTDSDCQASPDYKTSSVSWALTRQLGHGPFPVTAFGETGMVSLICSLLHCCRRGRYAMDELRSAVIQVGLALAGQEFGRQQKPRLYALTRRSELDWVDPGALPVQVRDAPQAALIPVEQDELPEGNPAEVLAGIRWPEAVEGCVLVTELVILPPVARDALPGEAAAAQRWGSGYEGRREGRLAVGVLRSGLYACCLQLRGEEGFLTGDDLADDVVTDLLATFSGGPPGK